MTGGKDNASSNDATMTLLKNREKPVALKPDMFQSLTSQLKDYLAWIDREILNQAEEFDAGIVPLFRYVLESEGKRIRPLLVLLSAKGSGGIGENHLYLAVVVEMIHLATLVHDDILDGASMRRGIPSVTSRWGSEISVLLGDSLFAQALKVCCRLHPDIIQSVANGVCVVCSGEILQTQRRFDWNLLEEEYLKIIQMKTGELFRIPCELAARLNSASRTVSEALGRFGQALGSSYQIYDDCLDLFGSEENVGKTLGTDLGGGKLTLPILYLYQQGSEEIRRTLVEIFENGVSADWKKIQFWIVKEGILKRTFQTAMSFLEKGEKELALLPESNEKECLLDVGKILANHLLELVKENSVL
ncbi:polyprenyl synthetase family protein [Candidatus Methylacidiphilum infernorum]|uniref:Polyprenyl synthetase family protein n=1 Tax=Candidatus Methylacidiphilum infernorum TaxID=511746 RepID=A0ABX7PUK1_9BACT|nr:polyprenyl synthetase family protein [Candidatus Methylacidiphilum infernorum]QSR86670.1 polyprenyl synthetase family protein [Candidatus Methylacidiphilum infernorum]